jgi:hypothetical protein
VLAGPIPFQGFEAVSRGDPQILKPGGDSKL